jgi:hypothetical protein
MLLTVVSQPAAGGTVTLDPPYPTDNKYYPDDVVTVTAQASAGYIFAEWSGDVSGIADVTDNVVSVVMTQNKTITASFVESWVRYTVTGTADPVVGGAVVISPAQDNYTVNQVVSVSAVCAPGYAFSQWAGDLAGAGSTADLRVNGNESVTAVFYPVLSVGVETAGTGTVEADPPATAAGYQAGTAVSLTARPSQGYLFDQWTGETAGLPDLTQSVVTLVVGAPRTLTARFVLAPRCTLSAAVQDQAGGSLSFDPVQPAGGYLAGQPVKVYALAAEGYVFSHWTGNASGTDPILQVDMAQALTIAAVFDPRVVVESDPAGGGEVEITPPQASGGYLLGSEVTMEARPAEGYNFTGWSGDISGAENPVTVVVDSPRTVTAVFEKQFVLPWWLIPVAAVVALVILVGLPLEVMLRRTQ